MTDAKFPAADPDDAEDVALALTTASSLWVSGEKEAAVRWLRKAQESANAAGSDARALELARAAADLTDGFAAEDDTGPAPSEAEKTQLTKPPMPPPGPGARLHTADEVAASNGSNGAGVDWGNGHSPEAGVTETTRGPILTQALRVCIKRSVRDDELFVARLLEDGQVPEGYCEALVVLTDPDQDLLDKLS